MTKKKILPELKLAQSLVARLESGGTLSEAEILEAISTQESSKGVPLDVTVRIFAGRPGGKEVSDSCVIGGFYDRPITVKRIRGVDKKYHHDIRLLLGEYENWAALEKRVFELNVFYNGPVESKAKQEALKVLRAEYDGSNYSLPLSTTGMEYNLYIPEKNEQGRPPADKLPISEASKTLDKAGIGHLRYCMMADMSGLFAYAGGYHKLPSVQVANISVARLNSRQ